MAAHIARKSQGALSTLQFFLPKDQIGYFRFILEAYDNLGTQSNAPGSTHITWTVPNEREREAFYLLQALLEELDNSTSPLPKEEK